MEISLFKNLLKELFKNNINLKIIIFFSISIYMTNWVVVKAWGIEKKNNGNNKQDGGHLFPPFGLHLAAPYMLIGIKRNRS